MAITVICVIKVRGGVSESLGYEFDGRGCIGHKHDVEVFRISFEVA
jgi:hypothetical protein